MIRQAVILAAGMGTRIRAHSEDLPKPLQRVGGMALIKRTILTLREAGVNRVFVIVGFMADAITAELENDRDYGRLGIEIECIHNPDYRLGNGVSVLCARGRVDGPFILSMSDHVYEPQLAAVAGRADMGRADLVLCVDRRIDDVYDIDDATKVVTKDDCIVDIGKMLTAYDAIDCGVFAVAPALLECLQLEYEERGDCSLSDGVRRLSESGRARVADIGDAFWQDVDTPGARARVERVFFSAKPRRAALAG